MTAGGASCPNRARHAGRVRQSATRGSRSEGSSLSGTGRRTVKYGAPGAPAGSWISTAVSVPGGMRHVFANRLDDPDHGWVEMLDAGTYVVTVRLHSAAGAILGEMVERIRFVPFEPERTAGRTLLAELAAATGAADADREARWEVLDARMERSVAGTAEERRALAALVAREHASLRAEIARHRFAGRQAEIAAWPTAHPWTPYDPAIDVPAADGPREIRVTAERRAHEASSIAVANLSGKSISVRAWLDPWTGGKNPPGANTVTLRRRVFVATARGGYTPDALPEIDPSGVVTIPAGETIRLWLDFASGGAPAGTYTSKLHLRALTVAGQFVDMPVAWEILPFQLPDQSPLAFHVWAYERPAFFDRESVWKDLIAHRVNVWDLPLAKVTYDAEGRIVSEDWSATEEILGRAPVGSWFFWSASDAIVKPAKGAPPVGSPAWNRAFRAWVPRWMDGLAARGVPRERHMNYILDEPGTRGGPDVEEFIRVAKLYKGVDPRVELRGAEHARVAGPPVHVDAHHVGLGEQLVEGADPPGVAVREPVGGVVEDHPQAHGLGEVGQLGADVAVADDAQRAAAHLVAALRRLVPHAVVHALGLLGQPARQHDDLGDHQLDDAAGVGVRRVEDRDAALGRGGQVDLVGADAEAADRQQVRRVLEHARGDRGVGADPQQVHPVQGGDQLVLAQRAGAELDLETSGPEDLDGDRVDVLEQQHLHGHPA